MEEIKLATVAKQKRKDKVFASGGGSNLGACVEDIEICELANEVLSCITNDLGAGIYARLNGTLELRWSDKPIFGACASSFGEVNQPPKHLITIYYAFAIQIWRDSENFCHLLEVVPKGTDVDNLYNFYDNREKLPSHFTKEEQVKNLFIGALTWVYFHEIGHLMQEHGHIRDSHSGSANNSKATEVHEVDISGGKPITGREAVISHTKELAADREANFFYVNELLRHIVAPEFASKEERKEVFIGLLYLTMCGLSIVFLRFNGGLVRSPSSVPEGSHPDPMIRLEVSLSYICESLSLVDLPEFIGHEISRNDIVLLANKASLSGAVYWSHTGTSKGTFEDEFMIKGLLTRSETLKYLAPIIKCWDEISPGILEIRRFGAPLGLLSFNDEMRERADKNLTWGKGPERHRLSEIACPPLL